MNHSNWMKTMRPWIPVVLGVLLMAGGCARRPLPVQVLKPGQSAGAEKTDKVGGAEARNQGPAVTWLSRPRKAGTTVSGPQTSEGRYLMNFEGISLADLIRSMMEKVFDRNFALGPKLLEDKRKISVKMVQELDRERTYQLFLRILRVHGVNATDVGDTVSFDLGAQSTVVGAGLPSTVLFGRDLGEASRLEDGDPVVLILPLGSIAPKVLTDVAGQRLVPGSQIIAVDPQTLVLVGTWQDARQVAELASLLDRPLFQDKHILMIRPKYWTTREFVDKLGELLMADGLQKQALEKGMPLALVPLETQNALMVVSSDPAWAERVVFWHGKLDLPEAAGQERRAYYYRLRNVEVESVTQVLTEFGKALGLQVRAAGAQGTTAPGTSGQQEARTSVVLPVKESNSLVILANPVEYQRFLDVLKKIDVPRNQVFIELLVGELSLDHSNQMGLEFWINRYLHNTQFGTKGGLGVYKEVSGATAIQPGSNLFLKGVMKGTQYEVFLNALLSDSRIDIVSSPKLTVLENEEAEIVVGSEIPVLSSESGYPGGTNGTDTSGTTTASTYYYPYRSIQYIKTGVILKVKASILSDQKIALALEQEISEAKENEKSTISSPEILKRSIKTTMVVSEGDVAFIGGLIQRSRTDTRSGLPLVARLPLLGALFRKDTVRDRKTELVVFINAKTIRRRHDMAEVIEGVRRVMGGSYLPEEVGAVPPPPKEAKQTEGKHEPKKEG